MSVYPDNNYLPRVLSLHVRITTGKRARLKPTCDDVFVLTYTVFIYVHRCEFLEKFAFFSRLFDFFSPIEV